MAQRRMISKLIIDTDEFLEMPVSSQALYFHLLLRADDDGFISSPRRIQKMTGAGQDDYNVLISRKYLIPFESGVCVIKHWRIHNYVKGDRYHPTMYQAEREMLTTDQAGTYILEPGRSQNGTNLEPEWSQDGTEVEPGWNQDGAKMDPQVRLGKDRIGKVRLLAADPPENTTKKPGAAVATLPKDELYDAIWQSFLAKTPKFTNYPKEVQATKRLARMFRELDPERAEREAEQTLMKYWELTQQGSQFWQKQPFTPSALSSSGIFDRVRQEMQTKDLSVDWVDDYLEAL